jgi:hypothetical protein
MRPAALLCCALVAACGSVASTDRDATPTPVDGGVDADPTPIDAMNGDAMPTDAMPARSGNVGEPMSAHGRLSGGGMVFDVQLGHPIGQAPTTGGGQRFEGAAAVKP